jgi:small-conductance mechanosensitive channel
MHSRSLMLAAIIDIIEEVPAGSWRPWASIAAAALVGLVVHFITFFILKRLARRTKSNIDDLLVVQLRNPARIVLVLLFVVATRPLTAPSAGVLLLVRRFATVGLILGVYWMVARAVKALRQHILEQYAMDVEDNLKARAMHTQINLLYRVVIVVIIILAAGTALMTFDRVGQLGKSLLASAGIIGIIVGIAAQKSLGNILAGIQIALTQPIRIDDVVIVQGEWGRVEEITLTYVVVRIWDLRRLIVPITDFIDKPFQNWTRVSADLLGVVFIYVDYTVPLEAIRQELTRILEASPKWDKKVDVVQVTNMTERTVEVRALVSAHNSGNAWDLRCEVREKLLTFLQRNYPNALPRVRLEHLNDGATLPPSQR